MAEEASTTKVLSFFLLWYALNVVYNDSNKVGPHRATWPPAPPSRRRLRRRSC